VRAPATMATLLLLICLISNSDDQLAEVASLQHADEGFGCSLEAVDIVPAIADAAIGDAGADGVQNRYLNIY
jgi:hypothetical protein